MRKIILLITTFSVLLMGAVQAKPIAESNDEVTPLLNGQNVPEVMVTTIQSKQLPLKDFLANKKTILFFYRGGWCPFCNTQMGQLKEIEPKLKALGFQLVGVSTDKPSDLMKSVKKLDLDYQLLSDFDSKISQAFGIAFFTSAKTTKRYVAKINLSNPLQKNAQGEERLVLPAPAVYVIDSKGLVQFNYVNPNFKVRLDEQVLLAAAKAVK